MLVLAACGAAVSFAMFTKARMAASDSLDEPSVVELPEARLFFGAPNALFGLGFYGVVIAAAAIDMHIGYTIAAILSLPALATSVYLGAQLVRRKRSCSRCWTAHVINVTLCPLLIAAAIAR